MHIGLLIVLVHFFNLTKKLIKIWFVMVLLRALCGGYHGGRTITKLLHKSNLLKCYLLIPYMSCNFRVNTPI